MQTFDSKRKFVLLCVFFLFFLFFYFFVNFSLAFITLLTKQQYLEPRYHIFTLLFVVLVPFFVSSPFILHSKNAQIIEDNFSVAALAMAAVAAAIAIAVAVVVRLIALCVRDFCFSN